MVEWVPQQLTSAQLAERRRAAARLFRAGGVSQAEIARQPVPADSAFYREFRNIRYYPGDRVVKMAVQQLGPALAYIPFISKMGYTYVIPPLHHDLTHAMNQPFFRNSTTFDNRPATPRTARTCFRRH